MHKSIKILCEYRKSFVRPLSQSIVAALLVTVSHAAAVMLIGVFLHSGEFEPGWGIHAEAALWAGLILALFLGYYAVIRLYTKNSMASGHNAATTLRLRVCDHIRHLPLSFLKRRTPSSVTNSLLNDMVYTESIFSVYIYEIAASLLIPLFLWLLMLVLDWRLALGVLCVTVLALPFLFISYRTAADESPIFMDAKTNVDNSILEYLEGIRELKGANLTGEAFQPFIKQNTALQDMSLSIERRLGLFGQAYTGILELIFVFVFFGGAFQYSHGSLPLLVFIFFLCMANRFIEPLQILGAFLTEFKFAFASLDRIADILEEKPLPIIPTTSKGTAYDFSFSNVSFSYGEKQVLKNICFHAHEGSVTALVGQSGSGKSTITNILLRFWDVSEGSVCVGGRDVRSFEQEELYSLFSVVFQDVYLFNDTVMNNIRLGKPDAGDDEVIEAARLAGCHEFILALEQGYATPIGQNGSKLSGGERQRISIARAILKNAPILILDEATASIDPENELQIQHGLNNLMYGKTLLVIAHRLSTIMYADQILVLKHGRILESGQHDTLLKKGGEYHALWSAQEEFKSWSIR